MPSSSSSSTRWRVSSTRSRSSAAAATTTLDWGRPLVVVAVDGVDGVGVSSSVAPFNHAPLSSLKVTSPFGPRGTVITKADGTQTVDTSPAAMKFHAGLDFRAAVGTPIFAVDDGVVESIERAPGVGLILRIRLDGRRERVSYIHLLDVNGSSGPMVRGGRVVAGQLIGHTGNGDGAVAPHLHIEVKPEGASSSVDPAPYLVAGGVSLLVVVGLCAAVGFIAWRFL